MEDKRKETPVDSTTKEKNVTIIVPSDELKKIIYEAVYKAIKGEKL